MARQAALATEIPAPAAVALHLPETRWLSSSTSDAIPDAPAPNPGISSSTADSTPANTDPSVDKDPLTLRKLPVRFLTDEAGIFTSPARIRTHDLVWLLPLAGATAAALATDSYTMRNVVSHDPTFNSAAANASDGLRDLSIAVPVGMFLVGSFTHNDHTREAGMLGGEAMLDAYVFDEIIKYGTLRERPYQDNANGHFFTGASASDPSFVSGHSIVAWSTAAVLAEEYPSFWHKTIFYTLAGGVSLTRVLGQQHFPTDTLLGSAAGYLIGHYVYHKHHRANPKYIHSGVAPEQASPVNLAVSAGQ